MLRKKSLDNRTFESRMAEALSELPLYTSEWTNFNPSDPGITILENLTAFANLQLGEISEISDAVRYGLLKMCGFETKRGRMAKLLLVGKDLKEEVYLPVNKQLKLGDMCFETNRLTKVYPYKITGVYSFFDDEFHDYSRLTNLGMDIPAAIFGENPKEGNSVYFLTDGMPDAGEDFIAYVNVADRYNRNHFLEKGNNIFASIDWQIYTKEGFVSVSVKDASAGFLMGGEIRLKVPENELIEYDKTPKGGYCIRAVLKKSAYDITPRLVNVVGFLFEVYQKETLSSGLTFQKPTHIKIFNDMADEGYIRVFGKEQKGTSYYMYDRDYMGMGEGRYYRLLERGPGMYDLEFDKSAYGYEPEKVKNAVKVLIYSEEMMKMYSIGKVKGYDKEQMYLPITDIVPASFSIMARRRDERGEYIYDFVRPGKNEEDAFKYQLFETEGRIVIEDPGDYAGAELFIATATVFRGEEGNIRAGNVFKIPEGEFTNPGRGIQGCRRESLDKLHKRFLADIQRPYVAVTGEDYEILVKEIPQLCIKKVKAFADPVQNLVRVAVMPGTDEKLPMLSDLYRKEISEYLDLRRLITTRIEIVQPVYIPVNVYGTIYIKKHFDDCRDIIEEAIRQQIDYTVNEKNFGDVLSFNRVFHAIESLTCVEYIYDLSLNPFASGHLAYVKDSDVVIGDNVLLYPGEISLDIGAYQDVHGARQ